MGEIAEMMLDGTLCECCGVYLGDADGFPCRCASCGDLTEQPERSKRNKPKSKAKRSSKGKKELQA